MTLYKKLFYNLNLLKERAFIPFVVLGDPTINLSLKIIDILIQNGADALELGMPFSDPLADGPIIQRANFRALKNGMTTSKCFLMLQKIREKYTQIPIGLLLYSNLVLQNGIKNFYLRCQEIKIDSILLVDVPIEEHEMFIIESKKNKISPIFICPPNADSTLINKICNRSKSYIYLLSRSGITGMHNKNSISINQLIMDLKKQTSIPLIQGFGIYNDQQIKNIISSGVSGVICGSVFIKIIEKNYIDEQKLFNQLKLVLIKLKNATRKI
ncbi:Tryptophan synthase alpha chain [Buchnera aphidicola (Eriosoma grossulariae)]|uniref:tryptophan synthase subunit alpha n=1 Tax=Buchnera aphidicola TaxID=9 RepID=UPI00346409C5